MRKRIVQLFAFLAMFAVLVLAVNIAYAAPLMGLPKQVNPQDLSNIILGFAGVILQLLVMYVPGFVDWYQNLPNKGLAMLIMVIVVGGVYFGLACSPLAAMLGITLACTVPDLYVLLQAIFIIAMAQTATYLYARPKVHTIQLKVVTKTAAR